jgi:signal transduction histidine kinase
VLLRRTATRAAAKRAAMEEELRLSQRLDAVGRLAAGIAHEINTPTQFVGDTIRFLREAFADVLPSTTRCAPP